MLDTASRSFDPIAAERLIRAVQDLSMARDMASVVAIVRTAARELTGADGATFILRDGNLCHYVDEDAIAPLWKGQKFPMETCVSGWAMLHGETAVIENIYEDRRVPAEAYRPTFVQSMVMVPVRARAPIAAIGNYWSVRHLATPREVRLLRALADSTSVAIENIQLYATLEKKVVERTAELEMANRELESFSYSVSHDLRRPVRAMAGYLDLIGADFGAQLPPDGHIYLRRAQASASEMNSLIDGLLKLAKATRDSLSRATVNLSLLAREIADEMSGHEPHRMVEMEISDDVSAEADPALIRVVLENLLANSWKFTAKTKRPRIEFGVDEIAGGRREFFVRDNGVGFDPTQAEKLFVPFQRLHRNGDFPGSGIGLATAYRIVRRHGGMIRAQGEPNRGAAFYFTLS